MSPAPASTRLLLRWALVLFTITIVIGILNGTDLVTFDRNTPHVEDLIAEVERDPTSNSWG